MRVAVHVAGEPDGPIQQCTRCGYVLMDHTNEMQCDDRPPSYWETGGLVYVSEGNPRHSSLVHSVPDDSLMCVRVADGAVRPALAVVS